MTDAVQIGIDKAFRRLECAIDAHAELRRISDLTGEPSASLSRLGCSVKIPVRLKGSRKRATVIWGEGTSVESAVDSLIDALDYWADAAR